MFNRSIAVLALAAVMTGCAVPTARLAPKAPAKAPAAAKAAPKAAAAKAAAVAPAAKAPRPSVTLIRGEELAQGLNEQAFDGELGAARGAIAAELAAKGLALPEGIAGGGYRLQAARPAVLGVTIVRGADGTAAGRVVARDAAGDAAVVEGVKGAGGELGRGVAVGADGGAAAFEGAKSADGAAAGRVVAKDAKGNAVAAEGVKSKDGAELGRWVAVGADGAKAGAEGWNDGKGNSGGTEVWTKGDVVVARRWVKAANGDAVLETVLIDKKAGTMAYSITAYLGGKLTTATATVKIAG
jgi:hypothetical protein